MLRGVFFYKEGLRVFFGKLFLQFQWKMTVYGRQPLKLRH